MKKEKLFTIAQLAKACQTSRATLLRLEKAGLLEPAYIDEESGYRYFDSISVFSVSRVLSYQDLGILQKELSQMRKEPNSYELVLQKLEQKLSVMEEYVENLRIYTGKLKHLSIVEYSFPEHYCYQKIFKNVDDPSLIRGFLWDTFDEAIHMGFSLNRMLGPYVSISMDPTLSDINPGNVHDYTVCIPIVSPQKGENIKYMPRSHTVSSYLYGGSVDIVKAFGNIFDYIGQSGMHMTGEARVISIISSYPGESIPQDKWVSRVCLLTD